MNLRNDAREIADSFYDFRTSPQKSAPVLISSGGNFPPGKLSAPFAKNPTLISYFFLPGTPRLARFRALTSPSTS
jgi:hypothetical protein